MGFFTAATAAAAKIFVVIDRIPSIDIFSNDGNEPNAKSGEIKFEDVHFSYPSRPDEKVNIIMQRYLPYLMEVSEK